MMHIMDKQSAFVKTIAHALRHRCRIAEQSTLLVGVSGGADSVALLRALHELAPRRQWHLKLVVCHVQHHLRPVAAEQDARFVAQLASDLGLQVIRHDLTPPTGGQNIEAWARQSRYAAFEQSAREAGAAAVLTAHHGDDLLETLLMRLLRGSGPQGLSGIPWRRRLSPGSAIALCRPMLATTHQQAVDYLQSLGQSWQLDHTNNDTTRMRAALRHQVLPLLKTIAPHAHRKALAISSQQRAMQEVMSAAVEEARKQVVTEQAGQCVVDRASAIRQPRFVMAALLRQLLVESGVPQDKLNSRQIHKLTAALYDGQGYARLFEYASGVTASLDKTMLRIRREGDLLQTGTWPGG